MLKIIDDLHQSVTPKVLDLTKDEAGSDSDKKDVLSTLYVFCATRLTDASAVGYADSLPGAEAESGLSLLNAINQNAPDSQGFLSALKDAAFTKLSLPAQTVDALANHALPLTYRELKNSAGTQSLNAYLAPQRDGFLTSLPTWATALLPVSLFGVAANATTPVNTVQNESVEPVVTGVLHKEEKPSGSFMKALLPIIGAIILAGLAWMLLKSCQKQPTPVAAPMPATTTEQAITANVLPATLSVALNETGDGVYACNGEMGSAGLSEQVKASISGVFATHNCTFGVVTTNASEMPAQQYIPQILGFMKGVPNASVSIVGKTIRLNASDSTALDKLVADIKGALPSDFTVEAEPVLNEAEAITTSIAAADTALSELTTTSTAEELVHALNLQIINFALDSSVIPEENKPVLDKAAELIKQIPDAHLKITGHTDNQGSFEYNQKLSESRAQSVHDYLVSKGVSDEKLEVLGDSFSNPVASNATEQGRFRNRRIEFTVFKGDEKIGSVASVAAAGVATNNAAADIRSDAVALANNVQEATTNVAGNIVDTAKNATATAANEIQNATNTATQTTTQP